MSKKGTSPWVWVGCGCFLCIVLLVAVIGGAGFAGVSFVKGMVEDMADPQARAEAAMRLLGAETLPDGYHARAFLNIPFLMQLVILSDGPPMEAIEGEDFEEKAQKMENLVLRSDQLGENTLIYLKLRDRDFDYSIEEIIAGNGRDDANVDLGVEFSDGAKIAEGELMVDAQPLTYRAYRGDMEAMGGASPGIYASIQVRCDDGEGHDVLWFQKWPGSDTLDGGAPAEVEPVDVNLPETETPAEPPAAEPLSAEDLAGTPADPEALEQLFSYFKLCG